jgi:hypothetical protein
MRQAFRFGLPFALIALANCGDASGPAPHDMRIYTLESIGGDTLPFLFDSSATQWDVVVWDSLKTDFTTDTTFETRYTIQHFPNFNTEDDEAWNSDAIAMRGDSVTLTPRGGAGFFTSRDGLVSTTTISVRSHGPTTPNAEYVYRLVSSSP